MTGNVHNLQHAPSHQSATGGGDGGNWGEIHGRIPSLEAHLQQLATKEDIRRLEAMIAQREVSMQRWLIGTVISAGLGLGLALIRLFGG